MTLPDVHAFFAFSYVLCFCTLTYRPDFDSFPFLSFSSLFQPLRRSQSIVLSSCLRQPIHEDQERERGMGQGEGGDEKCVVISAH